MHRNSGVRAKQIDPAMLCKGLVDELRDIAFAGDVGVNGGTVYFTRHRPGGSIVHVGHHNRGRTFLLEPPTQRPANSIPAASNDNDAISD
jgi:hypothetical protein